MSLVCLLCKRPHLNLATGTASDCRGQCGERNKRCCDADIRHVAGTARKGADVLFYTSLLSAQISLQIARPDALLCIESLLITCQHDQGHGPVVLLVLRRQTLNLAMKALQSD